jgi:hypothetical protein
MQIFLLCHCHLKLLRRVVQLSTAAVHATYFLAHVCTIFLASTQSFTCCVLSYGN